MTIREVVHVVPGEHAPRKTHVETRPKDPRRLHTRVHSSIAFIKAMSFAA